MSRVSRRQGTGGRTYMKKLARERNIAKRAKKAERAAKQEGQS